MKKGRHRRFEEARALKRSDNVDLDGLLDSLDSNEPNTGQTEWADVADEYSQWADVAAEYEAEQAKPTDDTAEVDDAAESAAVSDDGAEAIDDEAQSA